MLPCVRTIDTLLDAHYKFPRCTTWNPRIMRIRRTSNVPFYGRNNGILMNLSQWGITLTLHWHWSPKMNNDLFNLRTWRVLQFTVLSGGHNSIGYHHQTMGVQTVLTTTGRVKPPVSSFTGSVSTSTLWIYRKLIFTWFKLDGRQKKKPLRYKEKRPMHVSHKKLTIEVIVKASNFLLFIFCWM